MTKKEYPIEENLTLWDFVWALKQVAISAIYIISFSPHISFKMWYLKQKSRLNCAAISFCNQGPSQELSITNIHVYHFDWAAILSLTYKMCEMQMHSWEFKCTFINQCICKNQHNIISLDIIITRSLILLAEHY